MVRRNMQFIPLMLVLLLAGGCFKSESEYQEVVDRKEQLKNELAAATTENEILKTALDKINVEHQSLEGMVNAGRGSLTDGLISSGGDSSSSPLPPPTDQEVVSWGGWEWPIPPDSGSSGSRSSSSSSGRVYKPKSGDVLSSIAERHNTTVRELVELNPFLKDRRNYMIRESDEIILP